MKDSLEGLEEKFLKNLNIKKKIFHLIKSI